MKAQRILVCDAEPPNECVDSLMAAIEDGKDRLCSKNGADMEMCFRRGVGDARAVITAFQPDVILLMLGGSVFARTGAIVNFAESLSARPPVIGLIAEGGQEEARAVLRAGADDFILPPLRTSEILTRVRCALDRKTHRRSATTDAEFSNASGIIGKSPAFRREIERLPRIAGCDASVLISGETGTGKE
ncbi:MAG: sigma 54-interacting transcriptional regulator, partial [Terrimicrobiaceae bacterium]